MNRDLRDDKPYSNEMVVRITNELGQLTRDLADITLYSNKTVTHIEVSTSFLDLMDDFHNATDPSYMTTTTWLGSDVVLNPTLKQNYQLITRDMTTQECDERDAAVKEVHDLMNA